MFIQVSKTLYQATKHDKIFAFSIQNKICMLIHSDTHFLPIVPFPWLPLLFLFAVSPNRKMKEKPSVKKKLFFDSSSFPEIIHIIPFSRSLCSSKKHRNTFFTFSRLFWHYHV